MQATIFCVELTKLQKVDSSFTNEFFEHLLTNNPQLGMVGNNYYLLNNNININFIANLPNIYKYYSIFVQLAATKAPLTQILKNQ